MGIIGLKSEGKHFKSYYDHVLNRKTATGKTTMDNIQKTYEVINDAIDCYIIETDGDVSITELAEAVSKIVKEHYGCHNYQEFKKIINDKLKEQ